MCVVNGNYTMIYVNVGHSFITLLSMFLNLLLTYGTLFPIIGPQDDLHIILISLVTKQKVMQRERKHDNKLKRQIIRGDFRETTKMLKGNANGMCINQWNSSFFSLIWNMFMWFEPFKYSLKCISSNTLMKKSALGFSYGTF